jgi:GT2 family glycosyltransferase
MKNTKRIATLIVNWNKERDILRLLSELDTIKNIFFTIFVVDNASTDNSVESIRNKYPNVNLILNKKNLGGTGGFNSGLKYISSDTQYEYIWLLDNDARITDSTLKELVNVMDVDENISLAGSRIQDIDDPSIIVETGANFRWDTIGVIPLNRNSRGNPTKIIDVDYVAVCSALVRISAMKLVGIMDDRMFLNWDDMDWGLCFKKHGYRVVAVTKSIAYHGSFTERDRGSIVNYYYGIRNALLVYSKHTFPNKRIRIFISSIRFYLKLYYFFRFHNNKNDANLIRQAISDYYFNIWGKIKPTKSKIVERRQGNTSIKIDPPKNILISLIGTSFKDSMNILDNIKVLFPLSNIQILIPNDRKNYFKEYSKAIFDSRMSNRIPYLCNLVVGLNKKKFDLFVTSKPTPFMYAASNAMFFDTQKQSFSIYKTGFFRMYKLLIANLLGDISAVFMFPFILHKSLKYKREKL